MASLKELLFVGRYDEARAEARRRLSTSPTDLEALLALAKVQLASNELEAAEETLSKAEKQGLTADTLLCRATLAELRQDQPAAKALYTKAASAENAPAEAFFGLGTVATAEGDNTLALKYFAAAVDRAPENPAFHFHVALACLRLDRGLDAKRELEEAIRLNPQFGPAVIQLTDLLLRSHRLDEAYAVMEQAKPHFTQDKAFQTVLKGVEEQLRELESILAGADRKAQSKPTDAALQADYANALLEARRFQKALDVCQQAAARGVRSSPLKAIEASALAKLGKPEAAISAYEESMALAPNDWVPANNLAILLMKQGALPKAIALLEETSRRTKPAPEVLHTLALAWVQAGQPEKAKEALKPLVWFPVPANHPLKAEMERLIKSLG